MNSSRCEEITNNFPIMNFFNFQTVFGSLNFREKKTINNRQRGSGHTEWNKFCIRCYFSRSSQVFNIKTLMHFLHEWTENLFGVHPAHSMWKLTYKMVRIVSHSHGCNCVSHFHISIIHSSIPRLFRSIIISISPYFRSFVQNRRMKHGIQTDTFYWYMLIVDFLPNKNNRHFPVFLIAWESEMMQYWLNWANKSWNRSRLTNIWYKKNSKS